MQQYKLEFNWHKLTACIYKIEIIQITFTTNHS